jgi:hypothetical protein
VGESQPATSVSDPTQTKKESHGRFRESPWILSQELQHARAPVYPPDP